MLVVDERADETFTAPGDEVQRSLAAASAVWRLPPGLVGDGPEPAGTVIRPDDTRELARRAGYSSVDIVRPFWRSCCLSP